MYKIYICIYIYICICIRILTSSESVTNTFLLPPPGLLNTADLLEKISQLQVGQLKMSVILYGVSLDFFSQPKAETFTFEKGSRKKLSRFKPGCRVLPEFMKL